MNVYEKLMNVQSKLKAPKNQFNKFGNYSYRSCEDILEAVKPLLIEVKAVLNLDDEVIQIGNRFYVKATATFTDIEEEKSISKSAFAREDESQKGMSSAQVTGSVSSYARKYALNGLFCIDDTKDDDFNNKHGKENTKPTSNTNNKSNVNLSEAQIKRLFAIAVKAGFSPEKVKTSVKTKYKVEINQLTKEQYDHVCNGYEGCIKK